MKRSHRPESKISTPDRQFDPQGDRQESPQERLEMFFCLIPVFGLIPSAIALVRQRTGRKVRDVSQVAIALVVMWAIGFGTMGGVPADGQALQVTNELLKASVSSGYFGFCLYLMYRLYRHQNIALPKLTKSPNSKIK